MVFYTKYLPKGVRGFMVYPFIIVNSEGYSIRQMITTTCHEEIHKQQAKESWILGFYFIYLYELIKGLFKYRNLYKAYMSIRFEKEAYKNEEDVYYVCCNRDKNAWKNL